MDTTPEQRGETEKSVAKPVAAPRQPIVQQVSTAFANIVPRSRAALANVEWGTTLLLALVMALAWCGLFLANNILQVLAGVVPVMAGLYLGRRIKSEWLAHGLVLGFSGFFFGLIFILIYGALGSAGIIPLPLLSLEAGQAPRAASASDLLFVYVTFSLFALIPFPAFGTVMAGRSEQRNRQLRQETEQRGGRLERPSVVRTLEDLRGLSLPQFGSYVSALYRKKGFELKDYRFIDKDKHLDLEMTYHGELYLMRLSVADKVRPGTVESLVQDMRRREIAKGIVVTSTEFTPDAAKTAANRRNLLTIDGQTLFNIAEA